MKQDWIALAVQLGQLGFVIALPLVGGLLLGLWADQALGTRPLLTLLGSLLGIAAGSIAMYRVIAGAIVRAAELDQQRREQRQKRLDADQNNREEKE